MKQSVRKIIRFCIAGLFLIGSRVNLVASHTNKIYWFTCGTSTKATFYICAWHSPTELSNGGGLYVRSYRTGVEKFHKFDSDIGIPWANVPWPNGPGSYGTGGSLICSNGSSPGCRQVSITLETDEKYFIRPSTTTVVETPACAFNTLGSIIPIRSTNMGGSDNDPPKISVCPTSAFSWTQQPGSCAQPTAPDLTSQMVASDCSEIIISQYPSPGSLIPRGQSTILVTATDQSGNSASCVTSVSFQMEPTCIATDNVLCGSHLPSKVVLYRQQKEMLNPGDFDLDDFNGSLDGPSKGLWNAASRWCHEHNARLSTWDEVCRASSTNTNAFPFLNPIMGGYGGNEQWLPIGCAGDNEWVMVGKKGTYDSCMLHSFVYGTKPRVTDNWGQAIMCTPLDDMPLPTTCDNGLVAGDIVTVAFNTDNFSVSKPVVVLMTLANITAGTTFYMTDTAIDPYGELKQVSGESWVNTRNGQTSTKPTDGTMKFIAPENIVAGTKIAYSADSTYFINGANYVNSWSPVHFKTHSPLANPEFWLYSVPPTDTVNYDLLGADNIHLYCMGGKEKVFLHSLIFPNQTDWLPYDQSPTRSRTSNSYAPYPYSAVESVALIGYNHPQDNHFRFRPQACGKNKTEYMKLLNEKGNWDYQTFAHQPVAITNTSNVTNPYSEFCNPKPDTREAAMSQMTQQLLIEEAVQEAEQAVEMAMMTVAVEIEAREAFHKKNNEFRDRGSLYLPDGVTVIKGNENLMTQGIDPRTPIGFGNPFLTQGTAGAQQARLQAILTSMASEVGTGENQQTKKIHPLGGDESSFGTW